MAARSSICVVGRTERDVSGRYYNSAVVYSQGNVDRVYAAPAI